MREKTSSDKSLEGAVNVKVPVAPVSLGASTKATEVNRSEVERTYQERQEKLKELDNWLPDLKRQLRDFFETSTAVKSVLLQIDDLYHLKREDQAFVVDYVHRLCKDLPLFFKIATLDSSNPPS